MRILFLYTELADYTLACIRSLRRNSPQSAILVMYYPVNAEAPFVFDLSTGEFTSIESFPDYQNFAAAAINFAPDKIICSGWANKWYVRLCKQLRSSAKCILCIDNWWQGTPKQQFLALVAPFTIRRIFHNIWIPGEPQRSYARKLGFDESSILEGFYSCDVERFRKLHDDTRALKQYNFPKRFLCVARYIPAKGYKMLWSAFIKWKSQTSSDWELWCAGTGEGYASRIEHESIRHLGFVQKDQWKEIIGSTGVFVLPSLHEPWGVAVHEFAAAGFPLLLSNKVGAASIFLRDDNGSCFNPASENELIQAFDRVSSLPDCKLNEMGSRSAEYAMHITPLQWADTILRL